MCYLVGTRKLFLTKTKEKKPMIKTELTNRDDVSEVFNINLPSIPPGASHIRIVDATGDLREFRLMDISYNATAETIHLQGREVLKKRGSRQ